MIISTEIISENILVLIENFLTKQSFKEASEYVNANNNISNPLIFHCTDIDLVKCAVKYIPTINICDKSGSSVLMYACYRCALDVIKFFLDCGADVNIKNDGNQTALMWLCRNDVNEDVESVIELLIFSGADPHIKSISEQTAYDWVKDKSLLSKRSQQLLQGCIKMNNTKRATQN